jgi:hypothetical protein
MANYEATARTNYFRVKDGRAFEEWCRVNHLDFRTEPVDGESSYAVSGEDGWPSYNPDTGEDLYIHKEITKHLDPRDVAIFFEVGHEKLRYLAGCAIAVDPDGRTVTVNIDDIYGKAKDAFGPQMTILDGIS